MAFEFLQPRPSKKVIFQLVLYIPINFTSTIIIYSLINLELENRFEDITISQKYLENMI